MSNLKTKIAELERQLEDAKAELSEKRKDVLADSHIFKNVETHFYSDKVDRGYQWNEWGEICEWCRYPALDDVETEDREDFEELVRDNYGFRIDWDNSCLINDYGPDEITINDDGDVFEGNNCIIQRADYRILDDDGCTDDDATLKERNRLIEAHMERTGYFPGVFETDRYGNVTLVNTKE